MTTKRNRFQVLCTLTFALSAVVGLTQVPAALGQPAATKGPMAASRPVDPRVQQRSYRFADTNEDVPYSVVVSSKVSQEKKSPLILVLHGLGQDQNILLHDQVLDLAEQGGYILAAPMGYNWSGWFGAPPLNPQDATVISPTSPPNLAELSEKDVLNVLEIVRKEFNVDARRIYLLGHSMGGGGALHMGTKFATTWAAVAAMAPAAIPASLPTSILEPVKSTLPLILIHGDADALVPVEISRSWYAAGKEMGMRDLKYVEMPGRGHSAVYDAGMPEVFQFFGQYTKPASR